MRNGMVFHDLIIGKRNKKKLRHYFRPTHFSNKLIINARGRIYHLDKKNKHRTVRPNDGSHSCVGSFMEKIGCQSYFTLQDIQNRTGKELDALSFYTAPGSFFKFKLVNAPELTSTGLPMAETFSFFGHKDVRILDVDLDHSGPRDIEDLVGEAIVNIRDPHLEEIRVDDPHPGCLPATSFGRRLEEVPSFCTHSPDFYGRIYEGPAAAPVPEPRYVYKQVPARESLLMYPPDPSRQNFHGPAPRRRHHILEEYDYLVLTHGETTLYKLLCELFSQQPLFARQYTDLKILASREELCHACHSGAHKNRNVLDALENRAEFLDAKQEYIKQNRELKAFQKQLNEQMTSDFMGPENYQQFQYDKHCIENALQRF